MVINYPVKCPLMNEQEIPEEVCFDIHGVVDWGAPKHTAPNEAFSQDGYKEICRSCQFHRDD
ncbi:MAG: hypothetical protein IJA67_10440 [Oscillospiraceae bacterium]|nr:hypothetical protein [Oscillospiraceae bacterium]